VSKVKPESNVFYELIEIFHTLNLNDLFIHKNKISTLHATHNYSSSIFFINVVREDKADEFEYSDFHFLKEDLFQDKQFDFIFFEFHKEEYNDLKKYSENMINALYYVVKYQMIEGTTIFKIDYIFYKIIVDIIYLLSNVFEKVYIFKPSVCNIMLGERYIVCKNFSPNNISLQEMQDHLNEIIIHLKQEKEKTIYSLLKNSIPYYFINKIEESNIVLGQHQLESLSLLINLIKNKNKEDKVEMIKRSHIQKCIHWCEKYKIPHNKFTDKTNIFLNIKNTKENNSSDDDEYPDEPMEYEEEI